MDEYIKRKDAFEILQSRLDSISQMSYLNMDWHELDIMRNAIENAIDDIGEVPAADVQPLSVVAEHIKNRLYETAFNTTEEKARDAIADMAERIDFWIDELKDGDTNG